MEGRVYLNKALGKEVKFYGLSSNAVMGGVFLGVIIWMQFDMTVGLISTPIGYGLFSYIAKSWHSGYLPRYIYWNAGRKGAFGGKYLPPSHSKCFF